MVYLVGGGAGDPGLLTQAGTAVLKRAAVVVYDALVNPALLDLCPPDTEKIYVGKSAARHTLEQDRINALLVQKARQTAGEIAPTERVVVRLKGGDPYVFGRGGEEAQYLRTQGIHFAVIPGITAGIAGPAYAGIPVTHRDFTRTVTFITGHRKQAADDHEELPDSGLNYESLAALGGTLVFYMGVQALPEITRRLHAAGMAADMPAAVIQWATYPRQRTIVSTLAGLAAAARKAGIQAPAITIIGQVVNLRAELNWFESRPLFGKTVLVTRTRRQAGRLSTRLADLGANVIESPVIELVPPADEFAIDQALAQLNQYDCVVFTSPNGVEAAWRRMGELHLDARAFPRRVAAIGPATAEALRTIGITADLAPDEFIGEKLAAELIERLGDKGDLQGKQFLLLRADIARGELRRELIRAGAVVKDMAIYQTVAPKTLCAEAIEALRNGTVDWITFTSASTATNLHALLPPELRDRVARANRLSIGPITSAALCRLGWPPTVEATRHDIPGMIQALTIQAGSPAPPPPA